MSMVINRWVVIKNGGISCASKGLPVLPPGPPLSAEMLYSALSSAYPKFFKMDKLCKWAVAATEYLFSGQDAPTIPADKNNIAVCISTSHGCLDVDKRYLDGISLPSPALFVYTLPNIMLGELCIRHGFKGEQLCMASDSFDADELYFSVAGMFAQGMQACLCGWADVFDDSHDVCLFWVTSSGEGTDFTPTSIKELYYAGATGK